jgi:hypothetical protein
MLAFTVNVTLPPDAGQPIGTLFSLSRGGTRVAHAGAAYKSGTFYGNQHRQLSFYLDGFDSTWTDLGAPFPEVWTETRCQSYAGKLYATNRDLHGEGHPGPNAAYLSASGEWTREQPPGLAVYGGSQNVCGGTLAFEETAVNFDGRTIFSLDTSKHHSLVAAYADGRLLVFAVGIANVSTNTISISKWACGDAAAAPLKSWDGPSTGYNPPERNFPYAVLKASSSGGFLVATNLGDVYEVSDSALRVVHNWAEPAHPHTSWQPYTLIRHADKVLVGQYPSGGVFEFDTTTRKLSDAPTPVGPEPGAGSSHREAQELIAYADSLYLGVWPWGTVWSLTPPKSEDAAAPGWMLARRLFASPAVSGEDAPWEAFIQNATGGNFSNYWGQRVEGSCLHDGRAYFTTSAKNAGVRDWVGIIPEDAQKEYGHVWELDNKGQVSGHFEWPLHGGSTLLRFAINERGIAVTQDGAPLASRTFPVPVKLPDLSGLEATTCGARGFFGPCAAGVSVEVSGLV